MEPTPAPAPTATPPAADAPAKTGGSAPLPRSYVWTAVIAAAVTPLILLAVVLALLASGNYNFLNWME